MNLSPKRNLVINIDEDIREHDSADEDDKPKSIAYSPSQLKNLKHLSRDKVSKTSLLQLIQQTSEKRRTGSLNHTGKRSPKSTQADFIMKNILSTADTQAILEEFLVSKYNAELFSNKNLDSLAEKLGWDRESILAYFTKVIAQKRYEVFYNRGIITEKKEVTQPIDVVMEKLKADPTKYLKQLDVEVFDKPPDMDVMAENQILDKIVDNAVDAI